MEWYSSYMDFWQGPGLIWADEHTRMFGGISLYCTAFWTVGAAPMCTAIIAAVAAQPFM